MRTAPFRWEGRFFFYGAGFPRLRARGTDSHASDIGHWLGMTPLRGVRAGRVVRPCGQGFWLTYSSSGVWGWSLM